MDIWSLGVMARLVQGKVCALTMMDDMTGFAGAKTLENKTAETVAYEVFTSFFCVYGLARMVVIDQGPENQDRGLLVKACELLNVQVHRVTAGNHKAIRVERFHRYLNKVQKILGETCQSLQQWVLAVALAVYAWNAAPVDGTNIV